MYFLFKFPFLLNHRFRVAKFITFTASADHRVIDGAVGAEWMKAFKENLEDPANIIL